MKPFVMAYGEEAITNLHEKNFWALPDSENNLLGFSDTLGHLLPMDVQNKWR